MRTPLTTKQIISQTIIGIILAAIVSYWLFYPLYK